MTTSVAAASQVFAARIGRIEVSATMAVAAEAAKLGAQGANLVDFGAGEPHFPTPRHIKAAAIEAIEANFTRYTVVPGIPDVRKAIVQRHACDFGSDYGLDEACQKNPVLRSGINVKDGQVTHPAVADAHGLPLGKL